MDIKPFNKFVSRKNQGETQPSKQALLQHLRLLKRDVRRIRIQRFILLIATIALTLLIWHRITNNGTDSNTQHQPTTEGNPETRERVNDTQAD
ncbi:hypothetical protein [Coleofasciculus sp.]|uniref:hypothetical protein n=1 Tax=Coleofasciculus sp. TaxID=3100458 RepID=UPI003A248C5A